VFESLLTLLEDVGGRFTRGPIVFMFQALAHPTTNGQRTDIKSTVDKRPA